MRVRVCQHLARALELSCPLLADDSAVEALDGAAADVWLEVQQACFLRISDSVTHTSDSAGLLLCVCALFCFLFFCFFSKRAHVPLRGRGTETSATQAPGQ